MSAIIFYFILPLCMLGSVVTNANYCADLITRGKGGLATVSLLLCLFQLFIVLMLAADYLGGHP